MITRRRFMLIAAIGAASVTTAFAAQENRIHRWQGRAMGADVDITLRGDVDKAQLALGAAFDTIRRMEKLFSLYDPDSYLSRLNRDGNLSAPPPEFSRLMNIVSQVHGETGGLFDPTVQPVFARQLTLGRQLAPAERVSLAQLIGWEKVRHSDRLITFDLPGMALTLNGIAQGFATDRVFETLAAHGFTATAVNLGEYRIGDLPTDIRVDTVENAVLSRTRERDIAIATSSAGGYVFADGSGHILSPKKNEAGWDTVSVSTNSAAFADGYSTALILSAGEKLARHLIATGAAKRIILRDRTGTVTEIGA